MSVYVFKKNLHLAKRCHLPKVLQLIETYPKKYPVPKYLTFIRDLLQDGWQVKLYKAGKFSKYVFVMKNEQVFKIRFSNHKPIYEKEIENDCDYYVGISHTQAHKTEEILKIIQEKVEKIVVEKSQV